MRFYVTKQTTYTIFTSNVHDFIMVINVKGDLPNNSNIVENLIKISNGAINLDRFLTDQC